MRNILCVLLTAWAVLLGSGNLFGADPVVVTNAPAEVDAVTVKVDTINNTYLTFGLNKVEALRRPFLGNPLWQYVASLIYIFLAFYASKLLDYLFQVQLRKWASRTQTQLDDILLELLRGPVRVISFVIFLHIGLRVFDWPDWASSFISNGLKIVVALSVTYVALKCIDVLMGLWKQRAGTTEGLLDAQLFPVLRKTFKIFIVIIAVLVTCQNLGMNITGVLASLSIGGLAVGLAAQDTLSNLFGAVAIFGDKPFRVGERIKLDAIDGVVEAVGLRSTQVRNLDGHLVTIPNRTVANANIINISKRPNIKTVLNIGVTYDTPAPQIERAVKLINEVYSNHQRTEKLIVNFNRFDSSSLNIEVIHWWASTDWMEYVKEFQLLNLELKRRFDQEKINFAFPTQTLYLRQDSQWRIGNPEASGKNI